MRPVRKAAHACAYLLKRLPPGTTRLKLMKLLYLAEREFLARYGAPMTGDQAVSMPHGPVLSAAYDAMNADEGEEPEWQDLIRSGANNVEALARPVDDEELDELSAADIEVLDYIVERFGQMTAWHLREYTHRHCPEWEDPSGSSFPIPYRRILEAVGYPERDARDLEREIVDLRVELSRLQS